MTNEVAIHNLFVLKLRSKLTSDKEALDMAIKALEQQPCEDCISREVVKDMLTAEWTKYMPMELDMNLSFVLDKISALPTVAPKTEWIPVSERLPEEYCLFCDIDGDVYYGHIYGMKWWADGQDDRIKNVVAWMPFPQPYKEE